MKIGIVTFHRASNYGAVLQAFALQTFLRKQGHKPFFINHTFGRARGIRRYLSKTPVSTLHCWAGASRARVFKKFTQAFLKVNAILPPVDTNFADYAPEADAYICGSDQVWNPNYLRRPEYETLFFLNFGSDNTLRIAYAASIGVDAIPDTWTERFSSHLAKLDSIGMREKNAALLTQSFTEKPVSWVPDPTLLLDADDYRNILRLPQSSENIIFSYTLDKVKSPLVAQTYATVQKLLGVHLKETYERNIWKVFYGGVASPTQWLSSLASSRFVLTNSFHGTVFAILFQRPFIVLPLEGANAGMNARITSLLERVGLERRFITEFSSENIAALCRTPIDWEKVNLAVREFSVVGVSFLDKALSVRN